MGLAMPVLTRGGSSARRTVGIDATKNRVPTVLWPNATDLASLNIIATNSAGRSSRLPARRRINCWTSLTCESGRGTPALSRRTFSLGFNSTRDGWNRGNKAPDPKFIVRQLEIDRPRTIGLAGPTGADDGKTPDVRRVVLDDPFRTLCKRPEDLTWILDPR